MSCLPNHNLARYLILLGGPKEKYKIPILDVISVSGLGMGDQGTVTLTQQDRVVEIPDGIRKLPQLTLTFRFKNFEVISMAVKDKLFEWYNNRSTKTYDIDVFITNKTFCPSHAYRYLGSSIKDIKENDKEIGKADFSIITAIFTPYDIVALSSPVEAIQAWSIGPPPGKGKLY